MSRVNAGGRRAVVLALTVLLAAAGNAFAEGPTVSGAGSTWSEIAVQQWRADVARRGLNINYQGNGSTSGRQFYITDQVDFAVSEIPFDATEVNQLNGKGKSYQYLPIVAGGTSFMYNLSDAAGKRITDLRLSGETLAKIFTGVITKWNDPAIAADYGGVVIPERQGSSSEIIPVVRSDGSGTSAQFSAYLWKRYPGIWADFARRTGIRNEPTSYWPGPPQFPSAKPQAGSEGVANFVADDQIGRGSINYVEYGYAKARGRPVVQVKNQAGNFALPSAGNVAVALRHATFNPDQTQNLDGVYTAAEPSAYPVSSYSYMITPTAEKDLDAAKGNVLGKFILYFACDGQKSAEALGYSPLPPNLVQADFDAVTKLPGGPTPPPMSECDNPTIEGRTPPPTGFTTIDQPPAASSAAGGQNQQEQAAGKAASKAEAARKAAEAASAAGASTTAQALAQAEAQAAAEEAAAAEELLEDTIVDQEEAKALASAAKSIKAPAKWVFLVALIAAAVVVLGPPVGRVGLGLAARFRDSI
ncbi:MAG: substrate-binding domain-containing protein [Actinomycetota bacterium]